MSPEPSLLAAAADRLRHLSRDAFTDRVISVLSTHPTLARALGDPDADDYPDQAFVASVERVVAYFGVSGCSADPAALPTRRGLTAYSLAHAVEAWHIDLYPTLPISQITSAAALGACRLCGVPYEWNAGLEQCRTAILPPRNVPEAVVKPQRGVDSVSGGWRPW